MNRRERHNAKARQSTAGQRKKRKHSTGAASLDPEHDPNAVIIVPKSEAQKELDRRERLRQELAAQADSKMNSKKKKRLEKYIDKKLKQEERIVLFEKLLKSQAELPNALNLHSSATLGTGKTMTHLERLEREEHHEVKRIMDGSIRTGKRKRDAYAVYESEEEEDTFRGEDGASGNAPRAEPTLRHDSGTIRPKEVVVIDSVSFTTPPQRPTATVGGALQRNADGSVVAPRIVARKKKTLVFSSWKDKSAKSNEVDIQSDTSFDSSDSADDGDDDDDDDESASSSEGDEDMGSGGDDVSEPEEEPTGRKRFGFKEWAVKQLSAAKGYVASLEAEPLESEEPQSIPLPAKKRKLETIKPTEMRGPLGKELVLPNTSFAKHLQDSAPADKDIRRNRVVDITKPPEVEAARLLLPIVAEEQPIMEAILLNSVVVICGETGSGKTTQVPQFLYEAGFGLPGSDNPGIIGVTQPRRVAAMSMASRVAQELSLTSSKISYQIRYDATVSSNTSIKFMTDGVLLRELATDFLLTKYSVIIIDEAHERSMNTDILIGVLSRVVKLREELWSQKKDDAKPLRLIIMSATLRVSDFAENVALFPSPPPVINVPARQHPVTVHFNRRTTSDYVSEAIRKASKIHARLPPGGILIFLTGQNEISGTCKKLEAKYGLKALEERKRRRNAAAARTQSAEEDSRGRVNVAPAQADVEAEDMDLGGDQMDLALDVDGDNADFDDEALDSDDDLNDQELGIDTEESDAPMHIVPLYALLPSEKQMLVFKPPPPGARLVVVSTNVAETSLTIPGVRYVIDCGRAKERHYDVVNGIQTFKVSWISKASAAQRAGRAGRTGPGHCYRLYSSALFETYFEQFSQPEILRMPIEGVVLQMKSMHIDAVTNFPFPTPPDRLSLRKAEVILTHLGALTSSEPGTPMAMEEIHKLRAQLSSIVQTNFPDSDAGLVANLRPPTALQMKVLRQLLAAGFIDQVAVRKDKVSQDALSGQQFTTARGVPYRALGIDEDVFIHPSSVLANKPPPDFVVYLEVVRTSKVWIKGLTVVNAAWLSSLGKTLCTFSKPIRTKEGHTVVIPHFGPGAWELPPVKEKFSP
ncbi:hypothetical protein EW026_g1188 [Hermanssonia centrifuga]|uniref:RNA helicase n=1 Tax=Hermanssonia centrifuga TaxID=98765 RepID=A0A4S4KU02_9APHY|nr:hypothetical protein EW026_g1188 [Hermanssonia centrifuga]